MIPLVLRHVDYLLFAAGTLLLFGGIHRWLWRGRLAGALPGLLWLLVLAVLGSGWIFVDAAVQSEERQMQQMAEGYAPTYSAEIGPMGHQEITPQTSPDNPRYWRMAAAIKRWVAANPPVGEIFTLRKLADGQFARIVDANQGSGPNGKPAPIGAIYEGDLVPLVEKALAGESAFLRTTDRVSAAAPIRDFRGGAEAALIVNFNPAVWNSTARRTRLIAIGILAAIMFIIACGSGLLAYKSSERESHSRLAEQDGMRREKERLEMLVAGIDGIVWEVDAASAEFTFVSSRCEEILGYPAQRWMTEKDLWDAKLHPDDQWARDHFKQMVADKVPYSFEYRMIAADERMVWIRESGTVTLDSSGAPVWVRGVFYDITEKKRTSEDLDRANAKLVDSSRHAGMAEVATGVLHNVGNVLNSVNISGSVIGERLRNSKSIELSKVAGLLTLQAADFAGFVARDPRGPHIPELISRVADALQAEHADLLEEVESITKNISHIKEIVSMQQGFAKGEGIVEAFDLQTLVDDAIKINSMSLARHRITVVQAFNDVPRVRVDKHLVLQILVNLLRNAKQAIEGTDRVERRIVVKIQGSGENMVRVSVQDSGSGIAAENLTRIFSHGFTTKKTGHGFGLHSSALAATGMGGSLSAHSDGPGTGATFTLELPVFNAQPEAVAA